MRPTTVHNDCANDVTERLISAVDNSGKPNKAVLVITDGDSMKYEEEKKIFGKISSKNAKSFFVAAGDANLQKLQQILDISDSDVNKYILSVPKIPNLLSNIDSTVNMILSQYSDWFE